MQPTGGNAVAGDRRVNLDELLDVLANDRRRFLIAYLQDRTRPAAVADVATELTKWEWDADNEHIPKDDIFSRYISLHHIHIPKMSEVGFIEWNHERNTIALGEMSDGVLDGYSLPDIGESG